MKRFLSVVMILCLALPMIALAQEAPEVGLTALKAEEPAATGRLVPDFAPTVTEYYMYVQSDVYGVRFTPEFTGADSATVFMSGDGIVSSVKTIASGESFVLDLTQLQYMYGREVTSTAVLSIADKTYTLTVRREDGSYIYDSFKLLEYDLGDGHSMNYWLYVPEDYTPEKQYPVVLNVHGGGQTRQEPSMILKRVQQAGSFLRYGFEDCIIIAPHANYTTMDAEVVGWADDDCNLTVFGEGAYQILQNVKAEYSVDAGRVYVNGGSMGGQGTIGLLANHPEEFAAALACCIRANANVDKLVAALSETPVPLWIAYSKEDPVVGFENFETFKAALDGAGIEYKATVFDESDFLYPTHHFSWMPMFASTEVLGWMFSQSKDGAFGKLIDVRVDDPSLKETPIFHADQREYTLDVQHDAYGLRFTPFGEGPYRINGVSVGGGESYVFEFSNSDAMPAETYYEGLTGTVVIETVDGDYTYTIRKEAIGDILGKFEKRTFTVADGGEMYYLLYVPEDYDAAKKYPVVLFLHGSGKRWQPAENILMSNQGGTGFYKYNKDCIIIVPQCNYTDIPDTMRNGWYSETDGLSLFGQGAYDILQLIKSEYSVDENREYVTGLSMGAMGTSGMLASYPDEFAAAIIIAAAACDLSQWEQVARAGVKLWFAVHQEDIGPSNATLRATTSLNNLGYDYKLTFFPPSVYLSTRAHFSWVPMYANYDGCLDWLFAQSK